MHSPSVSRQSFPHLWKKLWKSVSFTDLGLNIVVFTRCFQQAQAENPVVAGLARASSDAIDRAMSFIFVGEGSPNAIFARQ
jgi:hypothetical protein